MFLYIDLFTGTCCYSKDADRCDMWTSAVELEASSALRTRST